VTFDTKGVLVEVETGVEGAVGDAWGGEFGGLAWDVAEAGLVLVMLATERRPEVSCAAVKFAPANRLIKRETHRYIAKS